MNFKITTFNLFQFCPTDFSFYIKKDKYSIKQWEEKKSWIKTTLKSLNSDIVAFQEVFHKQQLEKLCKELGYSYFASVDEALINDQTYTSCVVALASKYPINKIQTIQVNKNIAKKFDFKEKFLFSRKPIKVHFQIQNSEFIGYVFHLKSNRLNEFEYKFDKNSLLKEKKEKTLNFFKTTKNSALQQRVCEALHLAQDIQQELKDKEKHIFALGDLNDKEFCLCIDILTKQNVSLENSFSKTPQTLLFDTFYLCEKSKKRTPTSYYKTVGNVLDYIFVNKKLKDTFISYEILDTHLKDNKNGSLTKSDHAIVSSEFKLS